MARSFNGTSSYMVSGTTATPVNVPYGGGTKISWSFWLWVNAFGTGDSLVAESSTNYNSNNGRWLIDSGNPSGNFEFGVHVTGAVYGTANIPQPSSAAWHQYVLTSDMSGASPVVTAYVDGISQTCTPTGTQGVGSLTSDKVYLMSRAGSSLFLAGRLAEFAIYTAILTQADATLLAGGAVANSPSLSAQPVSYDKICGVASPEPDQIAGITWEVDSAAQISHPPSVIGSCNLLLFDDYSELGGQVLQQAQRIPVYS